MALISSSYGGSGQYYQRSSFSGSPNLRASHTLMVRVKYSTTSTSQYHYYINLYNNAYTTGGGLGRQSGDASTSTEAYRISTGSSLNEYLASGTYGDTDTWRHLCFVYDDSDGTIYYYVDGSLAGSVSSATTFVSSSTANVFFCGAAPGKFADAAFFDRALSSTEVADMAAYREPQVTSGLIGFWRFDSNANDSSGNSQNLSLAGSGSTPTFSTADNPPEPESPPIALAGTASTTSTLAGALTVHKALAASASTTSTLAGTLATTLALAGDSSTTSELAGNLSVGVNLAADASTTSTLAAWIRPRWGRRFASTDLYRLSPLPGIDLSQPFTIAGWVRYLSLGGSGFYGHAFRVTLGSSIIAAGWTTSGSQRQLSFNISDAVAPDSYSYTENTDSDWHHIALTYDGATVRSYVDGTLVDSAAFAGAATTSVDYITIGRFGDSGVAEVAQVKVWVGSYLDVTALSTEMDYHTPHHNEATLYGWWPLTWQDPTADASGNGLTLSSGSSDEAQTESPGQEGTPYLQLSSAASTTSTLAGTMAVAVALAGDANTVSTLAGSMVTNVPLAADAATTSTLDGTLTQAQPLVGAAATTSALDGALEVAVAMAADSATTSTLSGTLSVAVALVSAAATTSTLAGDIVLAKAIAGDMATTSSMMGFLAIDGSLSGFMQTTSTLAPADLHVHRPLLGDAATTSELAGTLSQQQPLAADAATVSTLAGDLLVGQALEGALSTVSELAGDLRVAVALAADMDTVSALAGTLTLQQALAGALSTSSILAGALDVGNNLAGDAATVSTLAGTLSVDVIWYLESDASTVSTLQGALTVAHTATAGSNSITSGASKALYGPAVVKDPPRPGTRRRWPRKLT